MAPWPWQMENTVVDSTRHSRGSPAPPCIILSLRQLLLVVRPLRLLYSLEHWELALPIFFFFAYALSFVFSLLKPLLSLKRQLSLLSVGLSSMARSRKGYPLQCVFTFWIQSVDHVGPFLVKHSSLLPQKLGAEVLEEVILRTLSLLGEMNVLCYVWCVPSIPPAERQKNLHETTCTAVNRAGAGRVFHIHKVLKLLISDVV